MQVTQMLFPGGKKKAFTTSYDDGVKQDKRLLALMDRYGIRGTFNLNSGKAGRVAHTVIDGFDTDVSTFRADELKEVYAGQEIACHALGHCKLTDISAGTAAYQITEDRRNLEEITGRLVTGFAYPYGAYDGRTIRILSACGIHYARTVNSTGDFRLPENFLEWHPTCHHNDPRLMELLEKFCEGSPFFAEPMLFYLWGHAYEFDQRDNWDVIERAFSYVERFRGEIWMASNGELYDYVTAFRGLEFSADGSLAKNSSSQELWLGVDGETRTVPAGETVCLL